MQHTIVILTSVLSEVFRRKGAQKWPIFGGTLLYRKSFKFAEYSRGAGPGRAGSPIQFFELILNNAPALRAGKSHFGSREARARCSGWGRKSESATDTTRHDTPHSLFEN